MSELVQNLVRQTAQATPDQRYTRALQAVKAAGVTDPSDQILLAGFLTSLAMVYGWTAPSPEPPPPPTDRWGFGNGWDQPITPAIQAVHDELSAGRAGHAAIDSLNSRGIPAAYVPAGQPTPANTIGWYAKGPDPVGKFQWVTSDGPYPLGWEIRQQPGASPILWELRNLATAD